MTDQERIRDLSARGLTATEIKDETGFSYPTIRKYLAKEDFSPMRQVKESRPSKIDP